MADESAGTEAVEAPVQPTVEEVEANTLQVGDEVWIPNSRKPQAIDSIVPNAASITLYVGDAQWVVNPATVVRKVVKA
jgi:hypothetical protein